uniref:Uncharacterized protein n=1 Tax=Anguilla anguilla TaxID=7936 RepID=A0A0E9QND4_ANGAN
MPKTIALASAGNRDGGVQKKTVPRQDLTTGM